jgi:hypothetical protein
MHILRTLSFLLLIVLVSSCTNPKIKEPNVSGKFYPSDKTTLASVVDGFLNKVDTSPPPGRLLALISPHAGYIYSGQVAAYSYARLKDKDIDTVIIIGPSHYSAFEGVSVYKEGKWKTPLGMVDIDTKIAKSLINNEKDVRYLPEVFEKEHSVEVQIPFLQRVLDDFKIVPLLIGRPTKKSYDYLTQRLAELILKNKKIMIIASTDLSHYHDYDTAVKMDRVTIDAVLGLAIEDLRKMLSKGEAEMCGAYPVLYTLRAVKDAGATRGVLFKYANSGDVTGQKQSVVGYAAIGLYSDTGLTLLEKKKLLDLAKKTIFMYVKEGKIPEPEIKDERLLAKGATFVTIKKHGILRGCIGDIVPRLPLYKSVIKNAVFACSRDPRFRPVSKDELNDLEIEISILSPLKEVKDVKDIRIGRDGLYIVKGGRSGLLLPQVPLEFGWDRDEFLRHVCMKAGLPPDAWRDARLYSFTAEVFSEKEIIQ